MVFFFLNFYVAFNAKMVVNMRTKKFFETEGIYCFFTFCTDWFSYFWIDMFRGIIDKKTDKEEPLVRFADFVLRFVFGKRRQIGLERVIGRNMLMK